jgi:hypothetical protein
MASDFETVVLFQIMDFRVDYSDFRYRNYHCNNSLHYSTHFRQHINFAFVAMWPAMKAPLTHISIIKNEIFYSSFPCYSPCHQSRRC